MSYNFTPLGLTGKCVFLFLLAFLPRALQPVSRPLVWYLRSAHFIQAVLAADWANTVYSEHPGVALMWPAGIGLKVYWTLFNVAPAAYTVPADFEPIHFFGPVPVAEIAAALAPLALLMAIGLVGAYLLLHRLFDAATATVAAVLLALGPYYLAQSKVLHLDAWMATLMLLSALTLLLYRREHRNRWLLLSGGLGGLALLAKTPALFLVPFAGLVLLVDAACHSPLAIHDFSKPRRSFVVGASAPQERTEVRTTNQTAIHNSSKSRHLFVVGASAPQKRTEVRTTNQTAIHNSSKSRHSLVVGASAPQERTEVRTTNQTAIHNSSKSRHSLVVGASAPQERTEVRTTNQNRDLLLVLGKRVLLPFCLWLLAVVLAFIALWPAMWVTPKRALAAIAWGLTRHASTAHDTPTFFLGQILTEDPGPLFYGVALLLRSGEVELAFLAVAAVLGTIHLLRHRRLSQAGVDYLLLLAYAALFLAQMCLAAKKMPRYVLPALMALDLLAAAGIVAWVRRLAQGRRRLALALMALPLVIQAALVLPHHPHYGTAFNWLAGGPPAAARAMLTGEEGEGLAQLAAYLNTRPDASQLTVAAQLMHVFNQTFRGTTVDIGQPADYLVFHRNYTVRDYKTQQWGELWERYAARTPEREIRFGGVPYAWLYPALSADARPEHPLAVRLGTRTELLGYDLREASVAPGDRIPLVLYWRAGEPIAEDWSVFVHLLDSSGNVVWQDDGAAAHGARPTWSWSPGEVIADPHTVTLAEDLPEGDYALVTGLYDWRTGERRPVTTPDGERVAQDQVTITTLAVRRPRTHPVAWIARGIAGLALLSGLALARKPKPQQSDEQRRDAP